MSSAPEPHDPAHHDPLVQLVQMANDIGSFFRAEPNPEDAIAGIANHVDKFWTPRMRQKILPEVLRHDSPLHPLTREALRRLLKPA